jgi:homoserine kinase
MAPRTAHVSVPASSANLGAGFDCVGLAVGLRLNVTATVTLEGRGDVTIARRGTLEAVDIRPDRDLITVGFRAATELSRGPFPGDVHFSAQSEIPVARGLGSSAAAVVAGAVLANATLELGLSPARIVDLCAAIEGHADNAAAAYYGGATLSVLHPGATHTVAPIDVHPSLAFVFAIPDFATETSQARSVLPPVIPYSRAVLAAARAAALVQGLASGNRELLTVALDDVLHVPYRRTLVHGFDDVTSTAVAAGAFGATLSGSGSSIVAVTAASSITAVREALTCAWRDAGVSCETFVVCGGRVAGVTCTIPSPDLTSSNSHAEHHFAASSPE